MKRTLLSITFLTLLSNISHAQSKQELLEKYKAEREKKEAIFKHKKKQRKNFVQSKGEDITTISSILGEAIIYNRLLDNKANIVSNVELLQKGDVGGFSLNGENMEITVFDGGAALDTHEEFVDKDFVGRNRIIDLENGASAIDSHATSVSGIIAGGGSEVLIDSETGEKISTSVPNATKGVLPKARISNASYATVNNLGIFEKLLVFEKNISNHSYGVDVGWLIIDDLTHETGLGLKYLLPSDSFTSPSDTFYSAYSTEDQNYDEISYAFPKYTIVKSAGNSNSLGPNVSKEFNLNLYKHDGTRYTEGELIPNDNCQTGAYCIYWGSSAKNIITVGAVDAPLSDDYKFKDSNEILLASYSSAGPRKDGAIKPDLVALGTEVIVPTITGTEDYAVAEGTSFSGPVVTGVVGAITQLKRLLTGDTNYYFNSDEVKAILLHTTQEAGLFEGPDNRFGWGLLDGKKAAETVLAAHNKEIIFERNEKKSGVNFEKLISANNDKELKVTVTWIDPAPKDYERTIDILLYDTSSKLVNDFDVRVIDTETNEEFLPWKLDLANVTGAAVKGDNTVDNIEQISIKAPITGRKYKIIVSNKGNLVNNEGSLSNQNYTLLVTGAKDETLSTDNVIKKSEILVYPTITKDIVNIKTTEKIQKVDLIDLTGKLISTTKTDKINVASLPSGVYIVNITTDKGVTTKKIVKQ